MFDRQKFYDDSFGGMERQEWAQSSTTHGCLYAGPNETGCAIGVNITRALGSALDEKASVAAIRKLLNSAFLLDVYGAASENYQLGLRVRNQLEEVYGGPITDGDADFLADLQVAHDQGNGVFRSGRDAQGTDRLIRFIRVAQKYDLTPLPFSL